MPFSVLKPDHNSFCLCDQTTSEYFFQTDHLFLYSIHLHLSSYSFLTLPLLALSRSLALSHTHFLNNHFLLHLNFSWHTKFHFHLIKYILTHSYHSSQDSPVAYSIIYFLTFVNIFLQHIKLTYLISFSSRNIHSIFTCNHNYLAV